LTPSPPTTTPDPIAPGPGAVESRADIHMHTSCSDGLPTPEALARHLAQTDLAVVAVTDHDTVEGAYRVAAAMAGGPGPEVIIGEEVTSSGGHILALYIERRIPPGMSPAATIDAIHEQGGLAVAAHPLSFPSTTGRKFFLGVGTLAWTLPFDAVELVNGTPLAEIGNRRTRLLHQRAGQVSAGVGGSDAHVAAAVGHVHTIFRGTTAADLRAAIEVNETRPGVDHREHLLNTPAHVSWLVGRAALTFGVPAVHSMRLQWQRIRT
jgi:predicted metal-dependent phosphoesterase TrpH